VFCDVTNTKADPSCLTARQRGSPFGQSDHLAQLIQQPQPLQTCSILVIGHDEKRAAQAQLAGLEYDNGPVHPA
jgi:hypothetical protein